MREELQSFFLKYANGNYDESMGKLYQEYEKELEKSNSLDFDDLLLLSLFAFSKVSRDFKKVAKCF